MPQLSEKSAQLLSTCDTRLQQVCMAAIKIIDFTIITGYRDKAAQDKALKDGNSKLAYQLSKHNIFPSLAIDIAPFPIDWNDKERFILLAGIILGIASEQNIKLRLGGDWDSDFNLKENRFSDLGHFEVLK